MNRIDLRGSWSFFMDQKKTGIENKLYDLMYEDSIGLPTTVSEAKKGIPSQAAETGFLTDPYFFEGYTWYTRMVDFTGTEGKELFLLLERTRISHVWVEDQYVGSNNSLCTSHSYRLTPFVKETRHKLTIMIDNTSYPTRGGHMTSPDTQTNWNGITGGIYIEVRNKAYLTGVKLYPDAKRKLVTVTAQLHGGDSCPAAVMVPDETLGFPVQELNLSAGENQFVYAMGEGARLWSEHSPSLYTLRISLYPNSEKNSSEADYYEFSFGLREFIADGNYFTINGNRTFLRGKHDGLIFPLTGYAPTGLEDWLEVLGTAKEYGINHYRFHTCCPPEAAFAAADILGIYMEPELPFWGTVTEEGDENHDEAAQQYLIAEGFRILDQFGNHPSFVMMSLGNELWGSQYKLNEILGRYKAYDPRHLYTQGSNNFQFMPCILENEDFFCGVRFSRDRLFRGSYAMCDAPQGHIQTLPPDASHNYDEFIRPTEVVNADTAGGEVVIQYGTGTKTVRAEASKELIPRIPVVSHEIGQYAMYPDYTELSKYTGVLKPRNLEIFRERLREKGLMEYEDRFFRASGTLAAKLYKAELEAALRSRELAGFQILDLQDFTGQGTALVGILNAFLENKGLISASQWREFCSGQVLLAELTKLVFCEGEEIRIKAILACFAGEAVINPKLELSLWEKDIPVLAEISTVQGRFNHDIFFLGEFHITLPKTDIPRKLTLELKIVGTDITNHYDIWIYPEINKIQPVKEILITGSLREAEGLLKEGGKVLYYPKNLDDSNSIPGTYCTDFWCYPMFRSISESMGRPVPVGTLGLLIEHGHKAFEVYQTEAYTTPPWYDMISNSRALILDETELEPVVWTIDNFERNHRLGNLFEVKVGKGKLLVCTFQLSDLPDSLPARWLEYSLLHYMASGEFAPRQELSPAELAKLFPSE